jgi:hypothetical protein
MAMDRKNKKAAQSAVAATATTGPGAEKVARSGVRGPKRELATGANGASGRLSLLAGGSTAPTRIMSPGSSGSTSSGRPPMNMPLKATISPSAPAPPLKDTDFTSFAALDEMKGFHLSPSSSQQVYRSEGASEEARTPDADLSKVRATDVPLALTPSASRLSMNNVTNDFGPIGSPPNYRSPVGHTSPSRANGNTFSPGTSPRAHPHLNGVNISSSPNSLLASPFSAPVGQDTFASPQYTTTGGIAASLGSGMMMSGRKWGDAAETAASVGASSFSGLFSSQLSSSVTNQRTIGEYSINVEYDEFGGSRHPRKLSRGAEIAVEDEDLEDFLPSSLNDLLTSEERSRRMSRSNSGQGSGAGHLSSALVAATSKESNTPSVGNGNIGHRYSRSVPAPTLLGDIKSIWADTGAQPMPTSPPSFPTHRGTPSASYSSRFDSMGANNHGEEFGLSMSVGSAGTPSSFGMISPSNASAAFLPGLHHHYLNAKAKQAQAQQQAQLGHGGVGRTLRGASNPLFTGASTGGVSNSSMSNNYLQPLRGLGLPSSASNSSGFHTHTHGNTQTTYRTTPSPFDLTQSIHQPQPQTSRPIPSTHNNSLSEVDDLLLAPHVISPSSRALQAHTPGQSLPQGLAAGYSRIHALPPVTNTFSPPTSGSFMPGSSSGAASGHEAPFSDWNKVQPTITVQGPFEAGGLGTGLDSVFSRLSYPTTASRSGNNPPPPPGLTRNINGGRYPQQQPALSPLSQPTGTRDDDDLFDMDK